ncbi:hypothetical protein OAV88_04075 [bacterium]|nr:hypothetical protein [bacterium]
MQKLEGRRFQTVCVCVFRQDGGRLRREFSKFEANSKSSKFPRKT